MNFSRNESLLKQIAVKIVDKQQHSSAPGNSTWGDRYPEAHQNLFSDYRDDMIEEIAEILRYELS